jgi:hypothetical protein
MSRRIIHIQNAVSAELNRHADAIECDQSISKIQVTVTIDRHSGMPARVSYNASSDNHVDTRLTEGVRIARMR